MFIFFCSVMSFVVFCLNKMSCYALFLFMNVTCTVKYLLAFFVLFFQLFLYKQEILSFKGVQCRIVLVVNF